MDGVGIFEAISRRLWIAGGAEFKPNPAYWISV